MSKTYNLVGGGNIERAVLAIQVTNGNPTSVTATNGTKTVNLTLNGGLPSGYTQLEYLESTGTQYINTGIDLSSGGTVDIDFLYSSFTTYDNTNFATIWGTQNDSSPYNSAGLRYGNSSTSEARRLRLWGYGLSIETNGLAQINTRYVAKSVFVSTSQSATFSINGQTGTFTGGTSPITSNSVCVFATNSGSIITHFANARIYSFSFTHPSNTSLNRNFVPAKRNSDGVLGMYDTVSDTFYTNSGTGTFLAGPTLWTGYVSLGTWTVTATDGTNSGSISVAADNIRVYERTVGMSELGGDYTKLEYLQSIGGDDVTYIDTGFKHSTNNNGRYVTKFEIVSFGTNPRIFGAQDNSQSGSTFSIIPWGADNMTRVAVGRSSAALDGQLSFQTGTQYTVDTTANGGVLTFSINGTTKTGTYSGTLNSTANVYAFKNHINTLAQGDSAIKMWYFQIYDSGTLQRNFVPARRNSDTVLGMYDKVTNTFFTNSGTGAFIAGPAA
jgi:hypothetical protein